MSKLLDSKTFGEKVLYNALPQMYHNADSMVDYALKRYLQVLSDGGFSFVVEEANGILNLNDPERTPSEVLSVLFEQYGLPLFNGIPEIYLRKLLPILGDLYARKGATTVIEYLTSIISDVKTDVVLSPDFLNDYHIDLKLEMDYDQTGARDLPDREQLLRIIKEFLPFFVETTIVFVYMFYETAKIQGKDYFEDYMTEVRNEDRHILSGNKEGLFPSIGNSDVLLNKNLYLNESYYYDIDVDWFKDRIIYSMLESGSLAITKSNQYLGTILNNPYRLLNDNLILNDYMEVDELVSTDIKIKAVTDGVNLIGVESVKSSLEQSYSEETGIPSTGVVDEYNARFDIGSPFGVAIFGNDDFKIRVEEIKDRITFIQSETGTFKFDKSLSMFKGVLNNYTVKLNDNLYTNEGVDVDDLEVDKVGIRDSAKVRTIEDKKLHMVLDDYRLYSSTNTGLLLNKDLLTNDGHTDIGNTLFSENFMDKPKSVHSDTAGFTSGESDEEIMTFTNVGVCVLNNMVLNSIPAYDRILVNGVETVVYPTQYGCISA